VSLPETSRTESPSSWFYSYLPEAASTPPASSPPGQPLAFLIAVPVTTYITAPNGVLQSFVEAAVRIVPGTVDIPKDRIIPALSALYIFMTFGATGAASGAGQAMGREGGLDDNRRSRLIIYFHGHLLLDGKESHSHSRLTFLPA
jgi:hypothetical protein